jgi:chromate transport protein ChrA
MIWFPDVSTEQGARRGIEGAAFAALALAAPSAYLLGFLALRGSVPGVGDEFPARFTALAALELVFCLLCAWRFSQGRGQVIGCAAMLVSLFNMVVLMQAGFPKVIALFYAGWIIVSMVNGIRGSVALARIPKGGEPAPPPHTSDVPAA